MTIAIHGITDRTIFIINLIFNIPCPWINLIGSSHVINGLLYSSWSFSQNKPLLVDRGPQHKASVWLYVIPYKYQICQSINLTCNVLSHTGFMSGISRKKNRCYVFSYFGWWNIFWLYDSLCCIIGSWYCRECQILHILTTSANTEVSLTFLVAHCSRMDQRNFQDCHQSQNHLYHSDSFSVNPY